MPPLACLVVWHATPAPHILPHSLVTDPHPPPPPPPPPSFSSPALLLSGALGKAIQEKLGVTCLHDSSVHELMRGIRSQIDSLITGLRKEDLSAMQLGLSHSLSR